MKVSVLASLLFAPLVVSAQPLLAEQGLDLDVRGFGSLVATKTSDEQVGWRVQNQPIGQARENAGDWALNAESILGVQLDVNSHKDLSASAQVIATNRNNGYFEPALELAFLRYKITPQWQMRLGRIWTPSFMNSETRYIGYSNTMLRNTNYTLYQITNLNGADVRFTQPLGSGVASTSLYYGMNEYSLPRNAAGQDDFYRLPQIFGGYVAWENEDLLLRSSFTRIKLARHGAATATIESVTVPALRAAYAGGSCTFCDEEANKWARVRSGVHYDVFTLAARYVWQNLTTSAEYILRDTDSTFPKASGFDVEVAYNHGRWTPYVDYLTLRSRSNNHPIFPDTLPQFASLNNSYAAGKIDRRILTLGLKYDWAKNLSSRAELMQLWFDDPKAGVGFAPLVVGAPGLPDQYRVYSLSLDFLF